MVNVNNELFLELSKLPAVKKIEIVEKLLSDLDQPDCEVLDAWAQEAEERVDQYRSGQAKTFTLDEFKNR
jgi:putative addiction module component (TIGR02574 family)